MRKCAPQGCLLPEGEARKRELPRRGQLSETQFQRAAAIMLADITADIDLSLMAEQCGFSRGHFIRAFRQTTGLPPYRWLLNERVKRACTLLENTTESIVDIALQCGFSDQSHMTRIFSNILGCTPAVWRRQRRDSLSD